MRSTTRRPSAPIKTGPPLQRRGRPLILGVAALLITACSPSTEPEPPAALRLLAPRVSINEVMLSWINPASFAVWDAARDSLAPTTDADWSKLEDVAIQLIASGTWITVGGTGPQDNEWVLDESWLNHTEAMTLAAENARAAATAQNLDAFLEAGNRLVESCEGCHTDFR